MIQRDLEEIELGRYTDKLSIIQQEYDMSDITLNEMLEETKQKMRTQCLRNVNWINFLCAYRGESLADHKENKQNPKMEVEQ